MPSSVPSKQPKNLRKSHCGLQWLCVTPARHVDWLARFLAATLSQQYDRGLSSSQSDFIFYVCRRLCLHSLWNRHFLEDSNISARSAIGFGNISHRRLTSPPQYHARSDWGLIRTSNVGPIVACARVMSMVDVANSMPTFGIWGPQDGLSIQ